MRIEVQVHPTATTAHELSTVEIIVPTISTPSLLDIDVTTLLKRAGSVPELGMDFLFIAGVVYAIDKTVDRGSPQHSEDRWTRNLSVTIPLADPSPWNAVAGELSDCLGFLTGDIWSLKFAETPRSLGQKKPRRRRRRSPVIQADAVSLFSGGLDSFIGAVDWLTKNSGSKLFLVGHYDGDVGGPKKDQQALVELLNRRYPRRFDAVQARVGLASGGHETSFRSRSFLFIALAHYFAEKLGKRVPIILPENGPIALNIPLTPSRRGACSTRTAHPHFVASLARVLHKVGFDHAITNPYLLKTKGEMVRGCQSKAVLKEAYILTRSCAKSGHKRHWANRQARGCGACVPCLFRRAGLHTLNLDDEAYGNDVCLRTEADGLGADFLALLSFLRWNPGEAEIKRSLLSNGPLQIEDLSDYAGVVSRMDKEVRAWLLAKASSEIKHLANIG